MALIESLGLASLIINVVRKIGSPDLIVDGIVQNRADAGLIKAWELGRRAFEKIRTCWHKLDLPENFVIQRAAALVHWRSVCHVTVFYARTQGIDIESGIDGLDAPAWASHLSRVPPLGVLAAAERDALRVVYADARKRLSDPLQTTESDVVATAVLDRLASLFIEDSKETHHPAIRLAFETLPREREQLHERFGAFFEEHWFNLFAVNFQDLVRTWPELANALHTRWLAEIKIELGNGRTLGPVEWDAALGGLISEVRGSEGRIIEVVRDEVQGGNAVLLTAIEALGRKLFSPVPSGIAAISSNTSRVESPLEQRVLSTVEQLTPEELKRIEMLPNAFTGRQYRVVVAALGVAMGDAYVSNHDPGLAVFAGTTPGGTLRFQVAVKDHPHFYVHRIHADGDLARSIVSNVSLDSGFSSAGPFTGSTFILACCGAYEEMVTGVVDEPDEREWALIWRLIAINS